jgi:hypothetical protein
MSTNYTLNIQVDGGNISADHSLLTADSVEYIVALFTFDKSWNNLYKTAIFRTGELVYHVPLENDSCKVPFEALKEPAMYISVFGVMNNTRATTAELPIQIQNSGYTMCEPEAPTLDPYNYFLTKVIQCRDEVVVNTEQCIENSKQAAAALEEFLSHEEILKGLSNEVQSCSTVAFDAAARAETAVFAAIANHNYEENTDAHPNILKIANEAKNLALNKSQTVCFDTKKQMHDWFAGVFNRADGKTIADLKVGDGIFIAESGVPDYWWNGSGLYPIKSDFSNYYTKAEIDAMFANALSKEE